MTDTQPVDPKAVSMLFPRSRPHLFTQQQASAGSCFAIGFEARERTFEAKTATSAGAKLAAKPKGAKLARRELWG